MNKVQKEKVRQLRVRGDSYADIGTATGLPVGTIKAYCSRNGIKPGQEAANHCTFYSKENEQKERIVNLEQISLIDPQSRVNTTMRDGLKSIENTRILARHPVCEVRVSFAAKPDEAVIADVLRMLMSVGSRR